jgi:hypothetical protein
MRDTVVYRYTYVLVYVHMHRQGHLSEKNAVLAWVRTQTFFVRCRGAKDEEICQMADQGEPEGSVASALLSYLKYR